MRRHDDRGRVMRTTVAVLCCLAAVYAWHARSRASWSTYVFTKVATPSRLGTAARPFGWSTAIGDMNGDGTPDFAVADRVGRALGGFEYSVDLAISGIASQRMLFSSPDASLSISLRDVDHDQDLDIVVSTLLSPGVVRIWLNDGSGAFAEASAFETVSWRATPSVASDSDGATLIGVASTPRRARDALAATGERSTTVTAQWRNDPLRDVHRASRDGAPHRSRAPPSAASFLL